jgi:transcriptional regulator with XRE-family HTH domain
MGRQRVNLEINPEKLRSLLKGKETFSERAEKYGVSKQALSNWLEEGRMPPRAIIELLRDLDVSPEDVDELLSPQKEKEADRKNKKFVMTLTVEEK